MEGCFGRKGENMKSVEIAELGRVSIIALMLQQILNRNLQDPEKCNLMKNRVLILRVQVLQMLTTVFFESDRIRLEDGAHGRPDIEIAGDMQTLLSVVLGANPLRYIFNRQLRFRPRGWKGWFCAPRILLIMQQGKPPACLRWLLEKTGKKEKVDDAG